MLLGHKAPIKMRIQLTGSEVLAVVADAAPAVHAVLVHTAWVVGRHGVVEARVGVSEAVTCCGYSRAHCGHIVNPSRSCPPSPSQAPGHATRVTGEHTTSLHTATHCLSMIDLRRSDLLFCTCADPTNSGYIIEYTRGGKWSNSKLCL